MMKNAIKYLFLFFLTFSNLWATSIEDEAVKRWTFIQANPWFRELEQAREKYLYKNPKCSDSIPTEEAVFNIFTSTLTHIIADLDYAQDEVGALDRPLSLMDGLYTWMPEATCKYEKKLVDLRLRKKILRWTTLELLMHLKIHDVEAFEARLSDVLKTKALEIASLMLDKPELADRAKGSSLVMDHLLDIGCNPQHPQSAAVFKRLIKSSRLSEPQRVKITHHLNAYLSGENSSVSSVISLLDDRPSDMLAREAEGTIVTYFVNRCTQPEDLMHELQYFLDHSTQFSNFYQVHNTLFQAFNRASFHNGVQLLWLNQLRSSREMFLSTQILTYFGCPLDNDLGYIPGGDEKDLLSRALYDALVSSSKERRDRASGFLRDKPISNIAPLVVQLGMITVLSDSEVSLKEKLQTFGALVDERNFTRTNRAQLPQTLDPVLTYVMDCTLTALDETLPSVQRCSAMNRLLDLKQANPDVVISNKVKKGIRNAFDLVREKSQAHRFLKGSRNSNLYLNPQRSRLYEFRERPRDFSSSDKETSDQITAFDADTGRALWMAKIGDPINPLKRCFLCETGDTLCAIGGGLIAFIQKDIGRPVVNFPLPREEVPLSLNPWGDDKFVLISGKENAGLFHGCFASIFSTSGVKLTDHRLKTFEGFEFEIKSYGPWVLQTYESAGIVYIYDLRQSEVAPHCLTMGSPNVTFKFYTSSVLRGELFYLRTPQNDIQELVSVDLRSKKELWSEKLESPDCCNPLFFSHNGSRVYIHDDNHLWVYATVSSPSVDDDDPPKRLIQKIDLCPAKQEPSSFLRLIKFRVSPIDEDILYGVSLNGEVNAIDTRRGSKRFLFNCAGETQQLFGINSKGVILMN